MGSGSENPSTRLELLVPLSSLLRVSHLVRSASWLLSSGGKERKTSSRLLLLLLSSYARFAYSNPVPPWRIPSRWVWANILYSNSLLSENEHQLHLKGSRQLESRGVRNVSNCPNLPRTAAIEVRFSLNFAVIFNFIYFRFRPSKAKGIGIVLPIRQNAASFFPPL